MIRVYTASKLSKASMWAELQDKWPHVFFHARWLRHVKIGTPDSPDRAVKFWVEDVEDITRSDALIVYGGEGEHLRGGLVEVGVALACGIPVIVVGSHPDYGTWQYHPLCVRVVTFKEAKEVLWMMDSEHVS